MRLEREISGDASIRPTFQSERKKYAKRLFVISLLMLALAAIAFTADDPLTGTWRETIQLTITPNGDGFSIIQGIAGKPNIGSYAKDFLFEDGYTVNIARVDDHTLASTIGKNGKIVINETATASADGKHFTRIREAVGCASKTTLEYDRVGSAPAGDAFFGTWQQTSRLTTYTIKVDGDIFDRASSDSSFENVANHTIKLDGKDSQIGIGGATAHAMRINAQTIEIIEQFTKDMEAKSLYQVKGNILTVTNTLTTPDREPSKYVHYFERIM